MSSGGAVDDRCEGCSSLVVLLEIRPRTYMESTVLPYSFDELVASRHSSIENIEPTVLFFIIIKLAI